MKNLIVIMALVLAMGCIGGAEEIDDGGDEGVACAMDAMECPDGSFVGRTPPECDFAPCPEEQVMCAMDVQECPDGSFVGRTPPECDFAPCPEPEEKFVESACMPMLDGLVGTDSNAVTAAHDCFKGAEEWHSCMYGFLSRGRQIEVERDKIDMGSMALYARALQCATSANEDEIAKKIDGYYSCYQFDTACWVTVEQLEELITELDVKRQTS